VQGSTICLTVYGFWIDCTVRQCNVMTT